MLGYTSRRFGLVHNILGVFDKGSTAYAVGTYPPARHIPEYSPMIKDDAKPTVNVSTLSNGVQILTESAKFPTSIYMGVLLNAGTRDETAETSGVMLALKNTFLKTNTRTNEQLNYCMAQMAGGAVSMNYDQESAFYKGHCLSHDVYDYAQMFADMILDEKTVMDEEAA
jgi:processing peptidase subunit beta